MYTKEELEAEMRRRGLIKPPASSAQGYTQGMAEQLVGGLLNTADFGLKAARGGGNVLRGLLGQEPVPVPEGGFLPSGREAVSKIEPLYQSLLGGEPTTEEQSLARRNQVEADAPLSTALGGASADIATLLTGRGLLGGKMRHDVFKPKPTTSPFLDEKRMAAVENARELFGRGVHKAMETGLEAGVLSIMNDEDPIVGAAAGAGMQTGGNLLRALGKTAGKHPLVTFGGLALANQYWREVLPMVTPNWYESSDQALRQQLAAYGLGTLAFAAGLDRVDKGTYKSAVIDAISDNTNTAARLGLMSGVLRYLGKEEKEGVNTTQTVIENLHKFSEPYRKKIETAYENGDFEKTMDKLKEDEKFMDELKMFYVQ